MAKGTSAQGRRRAQERKIYFSGFSFWILGIVLVILDQITKYWSRTSLADNPVDLGFVTLDFTTNTGSSFSMLQGWNGILIWFSIIVIGALIYWNDRIIDTKNPWEKTFYTLIIAGIIGNLIDRIIWGFVIDFIDLGWYPVFNVADSCLVVGVIAYAAYELFKKDNRMAKG